MLLHRRAMVPVRATEKYTCTRAIYPFSSTVQVEGVIGVEQPVDSTYFVFLPELILNNLVVEVLMASIAGEILVLFVSPIAHLHGFTASTASPAVPLLIICSSLSTIAIAIVFRCISSRCARSSVVVRSRSVGTSSNSFFCFLSSGLPMYCQQHIIRRQHICSLPSSRNNG
jgi:hypothetical protein